MDSAKRALQLVTDQYQSGIVSDSSVTSAPNTLFSAQQNAVTVAYPRMTGQPWD